jgi:hypothetical protein
MEGREETGIREKRVVAAVRASASRKIWRPHKRVHLVILQTLHAPAAHTERLTRAGPRNVALDLATLPLSVPLGGFHVEA